MSLFWETAHDCKKHGHYFEAKYDEGAITLNVKGEGNIIDAIDKAKPRMYVHDICVYCGHVIKREPS